MGGFGSFRQSDEGLAPMVIQTMLNAGDPTQKLHRKESNISFPEANVQTLRLGCRGSASFGSGCLSSPYQRQHLCGPTSTITGGVPLEPAHTPQMPRNVSAIFGTLFVMPRHNSGILIRQTFTACHTSREFHLQSPSPVVIIWLY